MMRKVLGVLLDRVPHVGDLRRKVRTAGQFSPGHFHSPIPAREDVVNYIRSLDDNVGELLDVRLNVEKQFELLKTFQAFYPEVPFPNRQSPACRYYYDQTVFCYGDAVILYSFLRHNKPQRIIEVGCGFSSCVMLDTIDRFFDFRPEITLIEPYPERLKRLLKPGDANNVTIIEKPVQTLPVSTFSGLQSGDLLFIDSSHVVKCGSDLQFLLFKVLPRLPVGVFVHFHDVFRGFEYPKDWLEKGWYWNEDYVLHAFLAGNRDWEIYFFNHHAGSVFRDFLRENMPICTKDPGGSLYIRRIKGDRAASNSQSD